MTRRKYIWFIVAVCFVAVLLVVGRNLFAKKEKMETKEPMTELEWLLTGDYKDTTEQHMGNLLENYQVLDEHILYLEEIEYSKENPDVGSILYKVDKMSKKKTKLLENVICFLEQNDKLYYSRYKDSYTELSVYNMLTGEIKEILGKKDRMEQVLTIDGQHILYLNYDECIMKCKLDGKEKEKYMEYSTSAQPFAVVKGKDTLFFSENGNTTMVSLQEKTVNKYITVGNYSDNVMVCSGSKVYFAIGAYNLKGWSQKVSIKSKWNGLWEIDMTRPYNKRKISDKVPKKLYWRNGILYDENFEKIVI